MKKLLGGGDIIYKCRRCGAVIKQMISSNLLTDLIVEMSVMNGLQSIDKTDVREHTIHSCKDGNLGITDIIGGEFDEDQNRIRK